MVYTQPTLRLQGTVATVYTRRHCHTRTDRHTHQCYVVRIQMTNSIDHCLLTQGVDLTSIKCVSPKSTKHQRKRTPPTLWCRKFISAYHYYDRLRFTYNNTPSPGWIVYRTAHCGTAFLSEDTAWVAMDIIVDSSFAIPKGDSLSSDTVSRHPVSSLLCSGLPAPYCTRTHRTILHSFTCTALHAHAPRCTHMHRTASHRTDMHRTASYCTHMHRAALTCTALHHTALTCTALHHTAFTCIELRHTALICTALHHIVLIYTATMHCQQYVLTTATLGRITLYKSSNLTRWPAALPPGMQL